ncbi:MAG TPA: GNAT family N-acetyltransferase [Iamia sp.]|nr:GNAT family N-acetyltransferase [Iamia sp.]
MSDVACLWRGPLTDAELVDLVRSFGGTDEPGWWDRVRPHSLGWVTARTADGLLVGFVNVAWDGGDHAFILDTKTRPTHRHRGIATTVVGIAADHARAAGCEWLHVDFDPPDLAALYVDACGLTPTAAALLHLPDRETPASG